MSLQDQEFTPTLVEHIFLHVLIQRPHSKAVFVTFLTL